MEEELKELERRVSRLEKITGNTYDIYLCNDSLKIPIELFKILFPSNSYSVENVELHKQIDKLRNEKKHIIAVGVVPGCGHGAGGGKRDNGNILARTE